MRRPVLAWLCAVAAVAAVAVAAFMPLCAAMTPEPSYLTEKRLVTEFPKYKTGFTDKCSTHLACDNCVPYTTTLTAWPSLKKYQLNCRWVEDSRGKRCMNSEKAATEFDKGAHVYSQCDHILLVQSLPPCDNLSLASDGDSEPALSSNYWAPVSPESWKLLKKFGRSQAEQVAPPEAHAQCPGIPSSFAPAPAAPIFDEVSWIRPQNDRAAAAASCFASVAPSANSLLYAFINGACPDWDPKAGRPAVVHHTLDRTAKRLRIRREMADWILARADGLAAEANERMLEDITRGLQELRTSLDRYLPPHLRDALLPLVISGVPPRATGLSDASTELARQARVQLVRLFAAYTFCDQAPLFDSHLVVLHALYGYRLCKLVQDAPAATVCVPDAAAFLPGPADRTVYLFAHTAALPVSATVRLMHGQRPSHLPEHGGSLSGSSEDDD